jgi:hypothetical protein
MTGARKDLRATLRHLAGDGWRVDREHNSRGHLTLRHPSGARVNCSFTPSCPHAHKHLQRDAARALASRGTR